MIPPNFDPDAKIPPGEVLLFERFRSDPGAEGWIVLHSLDVPEHRRQVEGEVDFVVIVPHLGVLCIEVKSHHSVKRTPDGLWHLGQDLPSSRGPFKQVSGSMHAMRERLKGLDRSLAGVPFASAVCFTHAPFDLVSPFEWAEWQVFDQDEVMRCPISDLVRRALDGARARLASADSANWFHPELQEPTDPQCERILHCMRPAFEFYESPRARRERRDDELRQYTELQFGALESMQGNRRVLFEGQAGTGKTVLAIEAARRSLNSGSRVGLICFNRCLAGWLQKQIGFQANSWVGTLHALMIEVAGIRPPALPDAAFWAIDLPNLALENASSGPPRFDVIVIDEAQDILRSQYVDVLDSLLAGGFSGGSWRLFGDFVYQAIYGAAVSPRDLLESRCTAGNSFYDLTENCRNPPRIAAQLALMSGAPPYAKVLRPDSGVNGEVRLYRSAEDQATQLGDILRFLKQERYSPAEIVILSRLGSGVVWSLPRTGWLARLIDLDAEPSGNLRVGTIHAFKGLEAPVTIVTDIDRIGDPESDALLYVGMSRATERLFVLAHVSTASAIQRRLTGGPHA